MDPNPTVKIKLYVSQRFKTQRIVVFFIKYHSKGMTNTTNGLGQVMTHQTHIQNIIPILSFVKYKSTKVRGMYTPQFTLDINMKNYVDLQGGR